MNKWFPHVLVLLDPHIKMMDKSLFTFIENQMNQRSYLLLDDPSDKKKKYFFTVQIVPADKTKQTFYETCDVSVELSDKNMSFLTEQRHDEGSGNLLFHDASDFIEKLNLVDYAIQQRIIELESDFFTKGIHFLKKEASSKNLKEQSLTKQQLKLFEELECQIYLQLSKEEINEKLAAFEKKIGRKYKISGASELFSRQDVIYFPLFEESDQQLYFSIEEISKTNVFDLFLFNSVATAMERFKIKSSGKKILGELEEIFSKLNIPIVVFDKSQHLILHNSHFISLNLSARKVFSLKINDQVTIENEVYKVQKIFIHDGEYIQINFIPVRDFLGQSGKPSSEELGIVSSSIAHELNNPLGGILAALNVLELDVISEPIQAQLEQMREGVTRCKKLVETFLGFSRITRGVGEESMNLRDCFNQAMDLVRFRLIENNLTISSEYFSEGLFHKNLNPYVLSMIFYLAFGELLTNFSHQKLVTNRQSPKLNISFYENEQSFQMNLLDGLNISENFIHSKLIQHLLGILELKLAYADNKIIFY